MVVQAADPLLRALEGWIVSARNIRAAVLFGSKAREAGRADAADIWSDVDLHLIVSSPREMEKIDWTTRLPELGFCLRVLRPASAGARKLTILFNEGEADLVLVPAIQMQIVRCGLLLGLHRRPGRLANALNIMATIMNGGYRFLKGEPAWGPIYAKIVAEMPGVRISNAEVAVLADTFVCDLLWTKQKIARGEYVAAQRMIHRSLLETNVQLTHELRLRKGQSTFQQARRVEQLLPREQLRAVQVSARLEPSELLEAAEKARCQMMHLVTQLAPEWKMTSKMANLLVRF